MAKNQGKKHNKNYTSALIIVFIATIALFSIGYSHQSNLDRTFMSYGSNLTFQTTEKIGLKIKTFDHDVKKTMENSDITVPGTNQIVSLVNGKVIFSEDGASGTIQLEDQFAVVKLGENKFNVFGVVVVNYGGSGDFVYVVLYEATAQLFENTDFSNVGDRVIVGSLIPSMNKTKAGGYYLDINYLDRGSNAPMSDTPTIKKELKLEVKDNKFISD